MSVSPPKRHQAGTFTTAATAKTAGNQAGADPREKPQDVAKGGRYSGAAKILGSIEEASNEDNLDFTSTADVDPVVGALQNQLEERTPPCSSGACTPGLGFTPARRVAISDEPHQSDLHAMSSLEELRDEAMRLRDAARTCFTSLQSVQKNADLKVQHLEFKILFLQHKLTNEQNLRTSLQASHQSLKGQLQATFMQARDHDDKRTMKKMIRRHEKEVTMEESLKVLLKARNDAVHQNTLLKRMLLQTCYDCRNETSVTRTRNKLKTP